MRTFRRPIVAPSLTPLILCFAATFVCAAQPQQAPVLTSAVSIPTSVPQMEGSAPRTETQGDIYRATGRYLAAIHAYEGVEPKTWMIYNKLGIASEHMRMNDQARLQFKKALELKPDSAEVYNNLGTLAHTTGDYKRAQKFYKKSIKLDPKSADAEKNLGTLLYARGKFKQGEEAYHRAQRIDSNILSRPQQGAIEAAGDPRTSASLHYHLARTYARAGSTPRALEYLRLAIGEGFRDKRRLLSDAEFASLWNDPAFAAMVDDLKTN